MKATINAWLDTPEVRTGIQVAILLNALVLGIQTSPSAVAAAGTLLDTLDTIFLVIFAVEIGLKIYARGAAFWRSGWDLFDFGVVAISLAPAIGVNLSVLRALRILRLFRAISMAPHLRIVVEAMLRALPGIGSVFLLLAVIFYVGSVIATQIYGADFPEFFGTLGDSAFSLFQIMTLEGWPDIARPVMQVYPNAWLFFVLYIVATNFCVLNLVVGLIVNSMEDAHTQGVEEIQEMQEKTDAYQDEALAMLQEIRARLERLENGAGGATQEERPGS